jgi:hypothetical protein
VRLSKYLPNLPQTGPIAIFVGAMARGSDDFADGLVDEKISVSDYPLSASVACGKVPLSFIHADAVTDTRVPSSVVLLKSFGTLFEPCTGVFALRRRRKKQVNHWSIRFLDIYILAGALMYTATQPTYLVSFGDVVPNTYM